MDMQSLLIMIVVGLVAGWLAGQVVKGRGLGLVGDIVVGILGSFIAAWLLPRLGVGLPLIGSPMISQILYSAIGAIILLLVVGLVAKRR
jgi:uncharacterized membrane protein YeaQ/YmgE (transglycosylase-associated protein family)